MSFGFKKIVSIAVVGALAIQTAVVPQTFAQKVQNPKSSASVPVPAASPLLQERLKQEKSVLDRSGKTSKYAKAKIRWDDASGKPSQIRGLESRASKNLASDVQSVFDDLSPLYGAKNTAKKAKLQTAAEDVSKTTGERHVRIKQSYSGLPIVGSDLIGHVDDAGNLYQIDGDYVPEITVDTVPSVTSAISLSTAKKTLSTKPKFKTTKPELVILADKSGQNLAWSYDASYEDAKTGLSKIRYVIDAKSGKTLRSFDTVEHNAPVNLSGNALSGEGGANLSLSGTLFSGDGKYYLWDPTDRKAYVYNYSSNTGTYSDAGNVANRATTSWGTSDPMEISAAYNLQKTLDFFKPFGFTVSNIAFTSTGQTLLPFSVHYGTGYNNAFWNPGDGFYFGDGDGTNLAPLATMDVVAHEFGHAWTENTSALIYLNEAGALNESFSDIVGSTVEIENQPNDRASYPNAAPGKGDWLIGEDVLRLPGISYKSLRDMRDPANVATVGAGGEQPTKYKGTYWYSGTGDNGGVHQNSGVQNHFYYLLAEGGSGTNDGLLYSVDGLGITDAMRVAYETNSHFLTSDATYQTARQAWVDAARSVNPAFVASVEAAWDAVGVNASVEYPAFVTGDESFENSASLPSGWTTDAGTGSWTVSSSTGAIGTKSLVSPNIGNSQSSSVAYSSLTDTGYVTFYSRTSSEHYFDFLTFSIDGVRKDAWSGESAWSPSAYPVGPGSHVFTWKYAKDSIVSSGLDEAGIDAVHVESVTGSVNVASATWSGNVYSKNGLSAVLSMNGSGTYLFADDAKGTVTRGTASGTVIVPLSTAAEGTGTVRFQYKNAHGFVSPITQKTFFVDGTAPTASVFSTGSVKSASSSVDLHWSASSDTGSGLPANPYFYEIASDAGFATVTESGSTSATGVTATLSDGTHFVRVTATDIAGNTAVSGIQSVFVDTVAPNAPTFGVNGGNLIEAATVSSVPLIGNAGSGEAGNEAFIEISSGTGLLLYTATVAPDGSFSANADVTSLQDGMLGYSAYVVDSVGNVGSSAIGTVGKSVLPSDGQIQFLSGSYVGDANTVIRVTAQKAVIFELSGSGLTASVTGSLASAGTVDVPVTLSAGEGTKNVVATFTDEGGKITAASTGTVLDTGSPAVSISSHVDGQSVTGTQVTITGTVSDAGGLATFTVGGQSMSASNGNWSKTLPLPEGDSVFVAHAVDHLGRATDAQVTVTRVPVVSNVAVSGITGSGFTVTFSTDVAATGSVSYGIDPNSLSLSATENSAGYSHSVAVTWLTDDTSYSAKAYGNVNGKDGAKSSIVTAKTPKTATSADYGSDVVATGSVWFQDSTSTGADFGTSSGSVTVYSDDGKDSVTFDLNNLTVSTAGWDGKFGAPRTAAASGSVNDAGYSQTGSTYAIGNDTARLAFSGSAATVKVTLGNSFNGKTLRVYHSNDGVAFSRVSECVVTAGICEFQAGNFSLYAFGAPSDAVPDAFAFGSKSGVELSTEVVSDPATLTGFNVPTQIAVMGGSYCVNSGTCGTAPSNVSSGDVVTVKVISSSAGLANASATVTVGGVSATFTVQTKNVVRASSGGGGGGGGGYFPSSPTTTATPTTAPAKPTTVPSNAQTSKNRKNVVVVTGPYASASDIAKLATVAKLKKWATSKNLPAGVLPKIDRLVTDRIVKDLNLDTLSSEARVSALEKAAANASKLAKSKTSPGERAVLGYVSEQLSKKAQEAKKPAKKKNVKKNLTGK